MNDYEIEELELLKPYTLERAEELAELMEEISYLAKELV